MLRLLHSWRGAIWMIAYFSGGFEFVALRWPLDVWSYFKVPYGIWNVKFDIIVEECALLYIWTCDCSYLLGTVWWPILYYVNNYWWLYVIVIALMRRYNFEKKKNGNCHIYCQLYYWYACWLDIGAWFFLLTRLRPTRSTHLDLDIVVLIDQKYVSGPGIRIWIFRFRVWGQPGKRIWTGTVGRAATITKSQHDHNEVDTRL